MEMKIKLFQALVAGIFILITLWAIDVNKRLKNVEKVVKHYVLKDKEG